MTSPLVFSNAKSVAKGVSFFAVALIVGTNFSASTKDGASLFMLVVTLWHLAPYGILWLVATPAKRSSWTIGIAGITALAADAGLRASVFIFPTSSTAALALIFSPVWILFIFMPAGALIGKGLELCWQSRYAWLKAASGILYGAILALLVLGLARPELFPTAVLSRRSALAKIGDPRVIIGANAYHKQLISNKRAWAMSSELDDSPGEEIALVDSRGADLFNALTRTLVKRIDFSNGTSHWNWFSQLIRLSHRLVIVQTGGGYSQTEVRELDGTLVWNYHPDEKLPPNSLRPADLNGDGVAEFYAASQRALSRLDAQKKPVWSREMNSPQLIALAPRTPTSVAWIATREYPKPVRIWSDDGQALGDITVPPDLMPSTIVDWPTHRGVVLGGKSLAIVGLDHHQVFNFPLSPMTFFQAISFLPNKESSPVLAVVAVAPKGVARARLILLAADGVTHYDEILDAPPLLIKARKPDGSELLLLNSRDGLSAMIPTPKP
jgi:hypothetical protein